MSVIKAEYFQPKIDNPQSEADFDKVYFETSADQVVGLDDELANYLPLRGGEMSGAITLVVNTLAKPKTDDSFIQINGATSYSTGAYIRINGKDESGQSGQVRLIASNGDNPKALVCYPNGNLKWDNKEVERVNASGTNYIRYESGLQICWGRGNYDKAGTVITYDQAFKTTPSVTVTIDYSASLSSTDAPKMICWVGSASATKFTIYQNTSATNQNYYKSWIAIGLWK